MHQAKLRAAGGYRRARYKAGKPAIAAPNRLRQVFVATKQMKFLSPTLPKSTLMRVGCI